MYCFSLKWRKARSEFRTSGRPSPGVHGLLVFQDSGLRPEGFIAWMPIPKGSQRRATRRPPALRSWPLGRRSRRFPPLPYPPFRPFVIVHNRRTLRQHPIVSSHAEATAECARSPPDEAVTGTGPSPTRLSSNASSFSRLMQLAVPIGEDHRLTSFVGRSARTEVRGSLHTNLSAGVTYPIAL